MTLPHKGTFLLARMQVQATIPAEPVEARLSFVDGKKGNGLPVENIVSIGARSYAPVLGTRSILLGPPTGGRQLPGDANQDAALDLSDSIWLLGHLFLGTPGTESLPCEGGVASAPGSGELALLDFNGDGGIDLSDPVAVLGWLFLGKAPLAPGVSCRPIAGCPERCGP
jgi:hypothetical protein